MNDFGEIFPLIIIAGVIFLIVLIFKKVRKSRAVCKKCKAICTYPDDIEIYAGELKWERKTKKEIKGDFTYEIEYRVFYRYVTFYLTCPKCGSEHEFTKRYALYRSDSSNSQSDREELFVLQNKVRNTFHKSVFANVATEDIEIEFPQGF